MFEKEACTFSARTSLPVKCLRAAAPRRVRRSRPDPQKGELGKECIGSGDRYARSLIASPCVPMLIGSYVANRDRFCIRTVSDAV